MRARDLFRMGFRDLAQRRLRTSLTIASIAIGVAAIVALVAQTAGIQASVLESLYRLGPNTVVVTPRGYQLTQADVARISSLPGVSSVIPMVTEGGVLVRGSQPVQVNIVGIRARDLENLLGGVKILSGSIYPDAPAPLALVGYNIAFPPEQGGSQAIQVGQPITIQRGFGLFSQRVQLQVVGILGPYGSTPTTNPDNTVYMPLDQLMKLGNRRSYSVLVVKANGVDSVDTVVDQLSTFYGTNVQILTVKQLGETVSNIIGQFGILLGSIAAISLSVAGLGTLNIMMITVMERTREIGVMKAVGFKNSQVLSLFLSEAFLIGAMGSLAGVLAGIGASQAIPHIISNTLLRSPQPGAGGARGSASFQAQGPQPFLQYSPVISPEVIAMAILLAIAVSLVAGLYPAWRAARMDPVRALRYE